MLMRLYTIITLTIFLVPSGLAYTNIECYNCSEAERAGKAKNWGRINIGKNVGEHYAKNVSVIDLFNTTIQSYKVQRMYDPSLRGHEKHINLLTLAEPIPTPKNKKEYMDDVNIALAEYKTAVESSGIPVSVIADPWEYVGCAYCDSAVKDWLETKFSGQAEKVAINIVELADVFGLLNKNISAQYDIPLEAGGYMTNLLELQADMKVAVTILSATDSEGNVIPREVKKLKSTAFRIPAIEKRDRINSFINVYRVSFRTAGGRVTVTDCPRNSKGNVVGCYK